MFKSFLLSISILSLANSAIANDCKVLGQVGTDWSKPSQKPYYAVHVLQQSLNRFGPVRTEIDGDLGPATNRAISAYQSENTLPATGRPDVETLKSLERDWLKTGGVPPITTKPWQEYPPLNITASLQITNGNCHVTLYEQDKTPRTHAIDFENDLTGCRLTRFYTENGDQAVYVRSLNNIGIMIDVKGPTLGALEYGFETPVIVVSPNQPDVLLGLKNYETRAISTVGQKDVYANWTGPWDNKGFAFHKSQNADHPLLHSDYWSWCPWK